MPTYQMAPSYGSTEILAKAANAYHLWLPENVWYVFAYLLGFYILLRAFDFRQHLAALGSIIWAFSTYFLIIIAAGAKQVMEHMMEKADELKLRIVFTQTGCMGYCHAEPTIEVKVPGTDPIVFGHVDNKRADEILEKYVMNNELVEGIIPVNYEKID